jgi:hypothetical protein
VGAEAASADMEAGVLGTAFGKGFFAGFFFGFAVLRSERAAMVFLEWGAADERDRSGGRLPDAPLVATTPPWHVSGAI